ncbi:MAG TPA: PRC-barrel domain-containing protein [Beijerinckiaceae bacterium]|jgi:hypothetical protein
MIRSSLIAPLLVGLLAGLPAAGAAYAQARPGPSDRGAGGTGPSGGQPAPNEASERPGAQPSPAPSSTGSPQSANGANNREPDSTGAVGPTQSVAINALVKKRVQSRENKDLGEVERVVADEAGKQYIVVAVDDGILGKVSKRVLLPSAQVAMRGDQLVAPQVDEQQWRRLPAWDYQSRSYRPVEESGSITVGGTP